MSDAVAAWLERIEQLHPANIELGLDRVAKIWSRHGCAKPAPVVLTVAGTNGKGSTVAILEKILTHAGFGVGCYTSPHLQKYNERIRIREKDINDSQLVAAFEAIDALRDDVALTYFEFGTLAALWAIHQAAVDIAVLEVGLGGRLDATNIIDADAAIVTSIGLDHTEWLGENLAQIGREKAGIFRPNAIAVGSSPALPASVREYAERVDAVYCGRGTEYSVHCDAETWRLRSPSLQLSDLSKPALVGAHQVDNAAGALVALEQLGLLPSRRAVNQALEAVQLPGRLQQLGQDPAILLDVAHNPDGARRIAAYLKTQRVELSAIHVVVGMLGDKDVASFCTVLDDVGVDRWYLASLPGARGASAEQLRASMGSRPAQLFTDVATALVAAKASAATGHLIVVTGSFMTVAEALTELSTT